MSPSGCDETMRRIQNNAMSRRRRAKRQYDHASQRAPDVESPRHPPDATGRQRRPSAFRFSMEGPSTVSVRPETRGRRAAEGAGGRSFSRHMCVVVVAWCTTQVLHASATAAFIAVRWEGRDAFFHAVLKACRATPARTLLPQRMPNVILDI
jgi:hypothetical protein